MMQPLISIVIANYNYGRFLEAAIRSVVAQGVSEQVELIICDAASTDNSVDVIKKYANGLPPNTPRSEWCSQNSKLQTSNSTLITWWCSERDGGQSAAFNKGFSHSNGKYLTWLNADDVLYPGCLKRVLKELEQHPECQWFTGNAFRFLEDGSVMEVIWGPRYYPLILQHWNSPIVVFGPSSFFSREVYEKIGGIDEQLNYAMDNDLWIRFMHAGIIQRRINCFIWAFRMHEKSKTAEFGDHQLNTTVHQRLAEEARISAVKSNYRMSWFLHLLVRIWRCLDGSMIQRAYLRRTFRKFLCVDDKMRGETK